MTPAFYNSIIGSLVAAVVFFIIREMNDTKALKTSMDALTRAIYEQKEWVSEHFAREPGNENNHRRIEDKIEDAVGSAIENHESKCRKGAVLPGMVVSKYAQGGMP